MLLVSLIVNKYAEAEVYPLDRVTKQFMEAIVKTIYECTYFKNIWKSYSSENLRDITLFTPVWLPAPFFKQVLDHQTQIHHHLKLRFQSQP